MAFRSARLSSAEVSIRLRTASESAITRVHFLRREAMRNVIAGFLVGLALVVSGVATDTASAQEVPVRGEDGWILSTADQAVPVLDQGAWALPENDEPSFDAGFSAAPATAPASPSSGGYSPAVEQWRDEVQAACNYAGCEEQIMRVINCESEGNPNAQGDEGEFGLLQVKLWIWPQAGTDPISQIKFAISMFGSQQGGYWSCQ